MGKKKAASGGIVVTIATTGALMLLRKVLAAAWTKVTGKVPPTDLTDPKVTLPETLAWAVAALDDCDGCNDLRIELTVEETDRPGTGLVAHLAPGTARRLRAALGTALRDIGEDPGP